MAETEGAGVGSTVTGTREALDPPSPLPSAESRPSERLAQPLMTMKSTAAPTNIHVLGLRGEKGRFPERVRPFADVPVAPEAGCVLVVFFLLRRVLRGSLPAWGAPGA